MAWDLRAAMLKKQEVESARLAEFDYRWRARTMRLLGVPRPRSFVSPGRQALPRHSGG